MQINNNSMSPSQFQKNLQHLDELYQKSQVSGVSTYLFTQALESVGLQKGDDLKAIDLLKEYSYDTGAPSVESILKYGNVEQSSGNHSYMKTQQPKKELQDIKEIDEKLKVDVSGAKNYFDVAQKLDSTLDAADKKLSIDTITTLEKYANNIKLSLQKESLSPLAALLQ